MGNTTTNSISQIQKLAMSTAFWERECKVFLFDSKVHFDKYKEETTLLRTFDILAERKEFAENFKKQIIDGAFPKLQECLDKVRQELEGILTDSDSPQNNEQIEEYFNKRLDDFCKEHNVNIPRLDILVKIDKTGVYVDNQKVADLSEGHHDIFSQSLKFPTIEFGLDKRDTMGTVLYNSKYGVTIGEDVVTLCVTERLKRVEFWGEENKDYYLILTDTVKQHQETKTVFSEEELSSFTRISIRMNENGLFINDENKASLSSFYFPPKDDSLSDDIVGLMSLPNHSVIGLTYKSYAFIEINKENYYIASERLLTNIGLLENKSNDSSNGLGWGCAVILMIISSVIIGLIFGDGIGWTSFLLGLAWIIWKNWSKTNNTAQTNDTTSNNSNSTSNKKLSIMDIFQALSDIEVEDNYYEEEDIG